MTATASTATASTATVPDAAGATTGRVATVRPAPHREPPFDDELVGRTERRALRLVRARAVELPFPDPTPATAPPITVRPAGLGEPDLWTRRLLLGLTECAAGRRPVHQLALLVNPLLLRALGTDLDRAPGRPRHWLHAASVRAVHVSEPAEGVAEVAATLTAGRRVRALALRLEVRHGRWQCVHLQMA